MIQWLKLAKLANVLGKGITLCSRAMNDCGHSVVQVCTEIKHILISFGPIIRVFNSTHMRVSEIWSVVGMACRLLQNVDIKYFQFDTKLSLLYKEFVLIK